jgi:hypothetical protein
MSRQKSRDGLQSIPSMAPAAYCMPLRNTELIPARSPILGELVGLGMRNAPTATNSRVVGKPELPTTDKRHHLINNESLFSSSSVLIQFEIGRPHSDALNCAFPEDQHAAPIHHSHLGRHS